MTDEREELYVWSDIILDPTDPGNIALATTTVASVSLAAATWMGYLPLDPVAYIILGGWLHALVVTSIAGIQGYRREQELRRDGDRDE